MTVRTSSLRLRTNAGCQHIRTCTLGERALALGEDFAELAKELSDDPGSAMSGGALGSAGKGVFDPAFEDAFVGLVAPGDISDPVRTEFGYHLIQLLAKNETDYPSFAQERAGLEQRIRQEQALDAFSDLQEDIERSVYDEQFGLAETAAGFNLEVSTASNLTRSATLGEEHQLLAATEVNTAIFSEELSAGENSPVVISMMTRALSSGWYRTIHLSRCHLSK